MLWFLPELKWIITIFSARLGFTKAVVASFDTLMAAHRGEVVCTVTTAKVGT